MEAAEFAGGVLSGIPRALHIALDDISPEQLTYRPGEHCNSIGWLVWHLTRVQDRLVSSLADQEQAWVADGWHARFGRPADPVDAGMGHGPGEVGALKPESGQLLLDYYDAVCNRTVQYVSGLSTEDLDRQIDPANPEVTVGARLRICILDNVQHAGQAAYLRGLIEGRKVYPS